MRKEDLFIFIFLPFLCEVDVFLRQDGEDLVKDLVRVGLTGQSHVVLRLVGGGKDKRERCDVTTLRHATQSGRRVGSHLLYLDLTRAVTQGSSLAGSEHGDHFVQASLQGTEHLPASLLLPAVSCDSHVQRARPGAKQGLTFNHLIRLTWKCTTSVYSL